MMPTGLFQPGHGVIYLQVGNHAEESLEVIIARKQQELASAGKIFWGFGSSLCHPLHHVRPFVKGHAKEGRDVYAVMEEMKNEYFGVPKEATQFSIDDIAWEPIPAGVKVRGSRYALILGSLEEVDLTLDLALTKVSEGTGRGLVGSEFIQKRVDKACLNILPPVPGGPHPSDIRQVRYIARLIEPYAVFVR